MSNHNQLVLCPFDPNHRLRGSRMVYHLNKCQKNHPDKELLCCPYNATHLYLPEDEEKHLSECADEREIAIREFRNKEPMSWRHTMAGTPSVFGSTSSEYKVKLSQNGGSLRSKTSGFRDRHRNPSASSVRTVSPNRDEAAKEGIRHRRTNERKLPFETSSKLSDRLDSSIFSSNNTISEIHSVGDDVESVSVISAVSTELQDLERGVLECTIEANPEDDDETTFMSIPSLANAHKN